MEDQESLTDGGAPPPKPRVLTTPLAAWLGILTTVAGLLAGTLMTQWGSSSRQKTGAINTQGPPAGGVSQSAEPTFSDPSSIGIVTPSESPQYVTVTVTVTATAAPSLNGQEVAGTHDKVGTLARPTAPAPTATGVGTESQDSTRGNSPVAIGPPIYIQLPPAEAGTGNDLKSIITAVSSGFVAILGAVSTLLWVRNGLKKGDAPPSLAEGPKPAESKEEGAETGKKG